MAAVSCSKGDYVGGRESGYGYKDGDYAGMPSDAGGDWGGGWGGSQGMGGGQAGVLTAGEWNDLAHWDFWGSLMSREVDQEQMSDQEKQQTPDYASMAYSWRFNTAHRIAVKVKTADGAPVPNAVVELLQGNLTIWTTRSSNRGEAQLWQDLFADRGGQSASAESLRVRINGVLQESNPVVSTWAGATVNEYVVSLPQQQVKARADVAFIVDATGSMTDEIDFLKKDLLSILQKVQQSSEIRTGAVFYRDRGDIYITRSDDFTTPSKTMVFIGKQSADGGGDLPEAVHTALETALKDLSWDMDARARMAFLILDAPAHQNDQDVILSLQRSIKAFATAGIRIVPVLASTGDKTTEFMCRNFAIVTGGTYVFLTDDSGVGGSHITPSVGDYQVEKLNDLLYRIINEYIGIAN